MQLIKFILKSMKTYKTKRRISRIKRTKTEYMILLIIFMSAVWIIGMGNKVTENQITINWIQVKERHLLPVSKDVDIEKQSIPRQIRIYAHQEKFNDVDYLLKLARCESRFDPYALNGNNGHSIDRGVFQINKHYHPEVSTECAMNTECATKWTIDMLKRDQHWQWSCDKIVRN